MKRLTKKQIEKKFPGIKLDRPVFFYRDVAGIAYGEKLLSMGVVRIIYPDGLNAWELFSGTDLSTYNDDVFDYNPEAPDESNCPCCWGMYSKPLNNVEAINKLLAYDNKIGCKTYFAGNLY